MNYPLITDLKSVWLQRWYFKYQGMGMERWGWYWKDTSALESRKSRIIRPKEKQGLDWVWGPVSRQSAPSIPSLCVKLLSFLLPSVHFFPIWHAAFMNHSYLRGNPLVPRPTTVSISQIVYFKVSSKESNLSSSSFWLMCDWMILHYFTLGQGSTSGLKSCGQMVCANWK